MEKQQQTELPQHRPGMLAYFLLAAFILSLSILRLPLYFLHPMFYAEDGHFLFIDSVERGWNALFRPMAGSPFLVARFISISLLKLDAPVFYLPTLYMLSGGLISGLSYAWFIRAGFRWIVPSDWLRAAIAVGISLLPGNDEIFFPLCSLYYRLAVLLILLLLEKNDDGEWLMTPVRTTFLTFLWLSLGQALIFVPALLYLAWKTRNKSYLTAILTLFLLAVWNTRQTIESGLYGLPGETVFDSMGMFLKVFVENAFFRFWSLPLFGEWVSQSLINGSDVQLSMALLVSLPPIFWLLLKHRHSGNSETSFFLILIFCVLGGMLLSVIVRPWGYQFSTRPGLLLSARFSVVPGTLALLFSSYLCLSPRSPFHLWKEPIRGALFLLIAFHLLHDPIFPRLLRWEEKEERWAEQSRLIEAAIDKREAGELRNAEVFERIPLHPRGWYSQENVLTVSP